MTDFASFASGRRYGGTDRIFLKPSIPPKKLGNLPDAYQQAFQIEDVVLLLDDTVFGSAKDGLVVTASTLYYKQPFNAAISIPLEQIGSVASEKRAILINGRKFCKLAQPSPAEIAHLCTLMDAFIKERNDMPDRAPPPPEKARVTESSAPSPRSAPEPATAKNDSKTTKLPLQRLPKDDYYEALRRINTVDNAMSFVTAILGPDEQELSRTVEQFQSALVRSVKVFRKSLVEERGIIELANNVATLEAAAAYTGLVIATLHRRGASSELIEQVIQEGVRKAFALDNSPQGHAAVDNFVNISMEYATKALDNEVPQEGILAMRLLLGNAAQYFLPLEKLTEAERRDRLADVAGLADVGAAEIETLTMEILEQLGPALSEFVKAIQSQSHNFTRYALDVLGSRQRRR